MSTKIAKYEIGLQSPLFVIVEMSVNRNQCLNRVIKIVDFISKSGAAVIENIFFFNFSIK